MVVVNKSVQVPPALLRSLTLKDQTTWHVRQELETQEQGWTSQIFMIINFHRLTLWGDGQELTTEDMFEDDIVTVFAKLSQTVVAQQVICEAKNEVCLEIPCFCKIVLPGYLNTSAIPYHSPCYNHSSSFPSSSLPIPFSTS